MPTQPASVIAIGGSRCSTSSSFSFGSVTANCDGPPTGQRSPRHPHLISTAISLLTLPFEIHILSRVSYPHRRNPETRAPPFYRLPGPHNSAGRGVAGFVLPRLISRLLGLLRRFRRPPSAVPARAVISVLVRSRPRKEIATRRFPPSCCSGP
jgi:hypothetical protein